MSIETYWCTYREKNIWQQWIELLPIEKQDIYFSPEYVRLNTDDDRKACCFLYRDNENIFIYPFIYSPVPRLENYFDLSTPYGYGGPVANTEEPTFWENAYRLFHTQAEEKKVIAELIKFHPLLQQESLLAPVFKGEMINMCPTAWVDTQIDPEIRWQKIYTHANRKNIKKAQRNNFTVTFSQEERAWKFFIELYASTMQANNADVSFLFTSSYYDHIKKNLRESYTLAICQDNERIAAVLLVLLGKTMAHCHLLGSDRNLMKFGVNNLLHHELINWCQRTGYEKLHIGGGRGNSEDDPLLKFKKNFTDKQASMIVGESILNQDAYMTACKVWQSENPERVIRNRLLKYRL